MVRSNILHHFTRQLVARICLLLVLAIASSVGLAASANAQAEPASPNNPLAPHQLYLPLLQNGSSNAIWSDTAPNAIAAQGQPVIIPQKYRAVTLNANALQQLLQATPLERIATAQSAQVIFSLPLPDGTSGRFRIVESPIMEPELAAKFPAIKTYAGQGIDDPTATVRFDWTPAGFHAMILSVNGTVYIDPYSRQDTVNYISYFKRDLTGNPFKEAPLLSTDKLSNQEIGAAASTAVSSAGTQLRTYRLAMASNADYTAFVSQPNPPNAADAMASITTIVNRLNGIYETEVAIRFILVANNNLLIYTTEPDPYTNDDADTMLDENQANLDAVLGSTNYDIGHVLTTSPGGGVASLASVCTPDRKGKGNSGKSNPAGDPFIVDFVAHEIGHQFEATHIFNTSYANCIGSWDASSAYEPGSGSTIMSYAGVCGTDNVAPHNDPYFNTNSFEQIVAFSTLGDGNTCPNITLTGNAPPVVSAGAGGFTIPKQTPFTLTGSATDPNGDALTYSWEEHDLSPAPSLANNPLEAPFFRSFPPVTSPSRTFPQWSDIVNNTNTIGEILPNISRALNFRLTARDNRANGGGVDYASITFNVTTAAGPFLVTAPDTAETWTGGTAQTVTWNVAGTDVAPVSCATVNILLSTDGGFTYPTTLASGVPNNGSASVTAPNISTTTARVQVACATNIFFDISNADFTITTSATPTPVTPTATNTPVTPATATPTPVTPTDTPVTPATATNTPVTPATATPTPVTPTDTPVATATNTPVTPATATPTPVTPATATNTPVTPATATNTPVTPATATNTPTATRTPTKTATPTRTPAPPTPTKTPTPTPTPGKVNNQLDVVSFKVSSSTTAPDATYPAQSTKGVVVTTLKVKNEGRALRNVSFRVVKLTNNNYLLNADGGPGQVGSKLSLPNSVLPGGNQLWDKHELLTQNFRIGLMSRNSFIFQLDVYASKTTTSAANATDTVEAEELVGSYLVEVDPEAAVTADHTIYLPMVSK